MGGKDKKAAEKRQEEEQKRKNAEEQEGDDEEKAKLTTAGKGEKSEPAAKASSGPTMMAALRARFSAIGDNIKSRIPSVPSRQ